jgi:hypothetical protein
MPARSDDTASMTVPPCAAVADPKRALAARADGFTRLAGMARATIRRDDGRFLLAPAERIG